MQEMNVSLSVTWNDNRQLDDLYGFKGNWNKYSMQGIIDEGEVGGKIRQKWTQYMYIVVHSVSSMWVEVMFDDQNIEICIHVRYIVIVLEGGYQ